MTRGSLPVCRVVSHIRKGMLLYTGKVEIHGDYDVYVEVKVLQYDPQLDCCKWHPVLTDPDVLLPVANLHPARTASSGLFRAMIISSGVSQCDLPTESIINSNTSRVLKAFTRIEREHWDDDQKISNPQGILRISPRPG